MQPEQTVPISCRLRILLHGPLVASKRSSDGSWKQVAWGPSRNARTVFRRLLAAPGRRLSRGQLADDLWPESDGDAADASLHVAISLIRSAIGKDLVTTWDGGYEIAGQMLVWIDLDAAEMLLKAAENAGYASLAALPRLEEALSYLERGVYLEEETGIWCHALRTTSETLLRTCRLWLAESYECQSKFLQAGMQYRALLHMMPPDERALQRWVTMLHQQGETAQAHTCYQEVKALAEEGGFALSSAIEQMVVSLSDSFSLALLSPRSLQKINENSPFVQGTIESNQAKDIDIIRRKLLEASIHAAEVAPLLPFVDLCDSDVLERFSQALMKPLHLDEMTFQYLEICTKQFWDNRQSAVFSSRDLYRPVNAHLQKMIALLEGSLLPTERTRLCSLLCQTSQLLGELSLDIGHYAQGKAFHQAALIAAQEAENRFLTAVSWGRISLACIYSKSHPDALIAVQKARSLAGKHATPMIQGWLAAIEAEIQAHLSQADLCLQALEQAERFDDQPVSPLEGYLVRFDGSLLGGYQGVCFRLLSHPEHSQSLFFLQKAQDSLRKALTSLDPLFLQRKPTLLADLASVTIYQRNIEEACTLISQAATLATQIHLHKVIQRLAALREPLRPWKELASVKTLDAHLAFLSSRRSETH